MPSQDLTSLVQEASRGDVASADALIVRWLPELRAFFRMRLGARVRGREDEDDLVQSVCREVLQDLSSFEGNDPQHMRSWLFLTAYRKLKDRNRYYGRARRAGEREAYAIDERQEASAYVDVLTPSRVVMGREQMAAFERAFDQLPEDQRIVVSSARVLNKSNAEIATEIGKSEDAVRMILHRALAKIGRLLDQSRPEG